MVVPVVLAAVILALLVAWQRREASEKLLWLIPRRELVVAEPPVLLGSSEHWVVLKAQYRGVTVAVKVLRRPYKQNTCEPQL